MRGRVVPEYFAVFAIDPGGVTGVARGEFGRTETGYVSDVLREAGESGTVEAWEVGGLPEVQAWEIAEEAIDWVAGLSIDGWKMCDVWIAFEGFALRSSRADLTGVKVAAGVKTLLAGSSCLGVDGWSGTYAGGVSVAEQTAADAKRYATRARMEEWGLWKLGRGSDHKKDALRHLALCVGRLLGE